MKVVGGTTMLIIAGGNPRLLPLSDSPAAADLYTCVKRFIIKYGICFMLSGVFCVSGLVQCLGISLMCLD